MDDFLKDDSLDLIEATLEGKTGVFEKTYSVGERIARRYNVERVLGRGNIGRVYQVLDEAGRSFAIKTVYARFCARPEVKSRLDQLAARLSSIKHDNLVPIVETGRSDDLLYLKMPLLKARPLAQALAASIPKAKKTGIPASQISQIVMSVAKACKAVGYDIPHLNLLPKNMFVSPKGLMLSDSGLMYAVLPALTPDEFTVMDGLEFLAPELKAGRDITAAADTYSLGAVLYSLATLRTPGPHPDDIELVGSLPPALADLIRFALDPNPGDRYPNIGVLADGYEKVLAGSPAPLPKPVLHLVTPLAAEDLGMEEDVGDLFEAGGEAAPESAPVSAEVTTAQDVNEAAEEWEEFRRDVSEDRDATIEDEDIPVFEEEPEAAAEPVVEAEPEPVEVAADAERETGEGPALEPEEFEFGSAEAPITEDELEGPALADAEPVEDVLGQVDEETIRDSGQDFLKEFEAEQAVERVLDETTQEPELGQDEVERRFFESLDQETEAVETAPEFAEPEAIEAIEPSFEAEPEPAFEAEPEFEPEYEPEPAPAPPATPATEWPARGFEAEAPARPATRPAAVEPSVRPAPRPAVAPSRLPFYAIVGVVILVAVAVVYFTAIRPRSITGRVTPAPVPVSIPEPPVIEPEATPQPNSMKEPTEATEAVEPAHTQAPDKATPPPKSTPANTAPSSTPSPVVAPPDDSTLEPIVVKTDLSSADISAVIASKKGRISYCFTRGLEENPSMSGVALVQFTIEPDGSVSSASVSTSSLDSPTADECLRRRVLRMRFPSFAGASKTVKFPFKYTQ